MTQEECPFRSSRVLHDDKGEFHLCNREGGDCECIPSGCPYLIAKNSKLNLPDLPGYVQIDNKEGEKSEIPTSLEEVANEYGRENVHYWYDEEIGDGAIYDDFEDLKVGFIEGAKWHEQQMMKEAVEAEITVGRLPDDWSLAYNPDELHRALLKFKSGDKVKIIIVKNGKDK